MDDGEKGDMGLQPCNDGIVNYASSGMFINTLPKVSGAEVNTYFASGWDPISSLSRSDSLGVSYHCHFANSLYHAEMENGERSSNSLVQYPATSSYSELVPKDHSYGSGSYSETATPLGLAEHDMIAITGYSRTTNDSDSRNASVDVGPYGNKRKRASDSESPQETKKNAEKGLQMNISRETSEVAKHDASKSNTNKNTNSKKMGKQAEENSHSAEASKDNYIHVRARRGQATNSHSLAERLRREKISERMRLLQDIVPGCNKITGKAVMLDEIINYVQSLQQQVEFLSMKLATVKPELHLDIERIRSKDFSHGISSALHGVVPGMSSSHPYHLGILQGSFPSIPRMIPLFTSSPQVMLDNEFQSLLQMGYNSNSAADNLGPDGRLR